MTPGRYDGRLDVTVVIAVAPGADPGRALQAVGRGLPRGVRAEILTVTGSHPSRQRNLAANRAAGRVLYFLDHDAVVDPATIGRLLAAMRRLGAEVAGGPNLPAPPKSPLEAILGGVIASPVGSPFVSARYGSRSATGRAGERSLILCNLAIKREPFLAAGGFDPRLYPNEENALLNRLARRGIPAVHVHDASVRKPRPATWRRFVVETFRYGRGRMQQIWVAPAVGDVVFAGALVVALAGVFGSFVYAWIPVLYGAVVAVESGRLLLGTGARGASAGARFVSYLAGFVLRHAAYASGMVWGALTGWRMRRLRWRPMRATLRRFGPKRGGMRLVETVSCKIGSMAKEAAPHA